MLNSKKLIFSKEKEVSGLISSLVIETPLSYQSDKSANKSKITSNQQLAEELYEPIKIRKTKNILIFKNNVWVASLADMQLIGKFNKGFLFLLSAIDVYSKYT